VILRNEGSRFSKTKYTRDASFRQHDKNENNVALNCFHYLSEEQALYFGRERSKFEEQRDGLSLSDEMFLISLYELGGMSGGGIF
ncbi:MAG: hypothetical protein LBL79_00960, partial [Prevotella sp.]|nr:hypothetical protein [Prevotella sp.]